GWTARLGLRLPTGERDRLPGLPLFAAGFLPPALPESNDLYEIDLQTKVVRRLTHDGDSGWIIPEFDWDPAGQRLMWTELKYADGPRISAPIDAAKQIHQFVGLLQAPPALPSPTDRPPGGPGTGIVLRTRIAQYGRPTSTSTSS